MKFFYLDIEDNIYTSEKYLTKSELYDEWMEHYDDYLGQFTMSEKEASDVCEDLIWDQIEGRIDKFDTHEEFVYELVKRLDLKEKEKIMKEVGLI